MAPPGQEAKCFLVWGTYLDFATIEHKIFIVFQTYILQNHAQTRHLFPTMHSRRICGKG